VLKEPVTFGGHSQPLGTVLSNKKSNNKCRALNLKQQGLLDFGETYIVKGFKEN
jgi:hypothetical protein